MGTETWRTIPGQEGFYEVSDRARVRSLDRTVEHGNGTRQFLRGRILNISTTKDGRRHAHLSRNGRLVKLPVDELVAAAFGEGVSNGEVESTIEAPAVRGEVVRVPFRGDEILTIDVDGKAHVVLKPVIEAIGLDYWAQVEKLRGRSWGALGLSPVRGDDGRPRDMIVVDVRTFLMLLATVDENRVAPSVRSKLVAYQAEVADAIESYFTRGGAINPRATEDQLIALADVAERRIVLLRSAEGLVDRAWLEAKARHELARGLGEEPQVDPATRPLTIGEFLEGKGVAGEALRSMSPSFGKRIKARYVAKFGAEPATVERFVDGALRPVCGYTEQHRDLFEDEWVSRFEH